MKLVGKNEVTYSSLEIDMPPTPPRRSTANVQHSNDDPQDDDFYGRSSLSSNNSGSTRALSSSGSTILEPPQHHEPYHGIFSNAERTLRQLALEVKGAVLATGCVHLCVPSPPSDQLN